MKSAPEFTGVNEIEKATGCFCGVGITTTLPLTFDLYYFIANKLNTPGGDAVGCFRMGGGGKLRIQLSLIA